MFINDALFPDVGVQLAVVAIAPAVAAGLRWGIPAVVSLLGGLFGRRNRQTSTTTPTISPEFQGLQNAILPMITSRLMSPYQLPAGFEQRGIRDINRTYDLAGQDLENRLTARGLGTSPIAGAAQTRFAGDRAGAITQFQETLPLLQRQFQQEDLANAVQFLNFGRGSTGTQAGTVGGGFGGGLTSLATMLAFLFGNRGQPGGGDNTTVYDVPAGPPASLAGPLPPRYTPFGSPSLYGPGRNPYSGLFGVRPIRR